MNAIFDEAKGVYRVTKEDGSFETYTPEQFRALDEKVEVVVNEEEGDEDVVIEDEVADVELQESADDADAIEEEAEVATATEEEKTEGGIMNKIKEVTGLNK